MGEDQIMDIDQAKDLRRELEIRVMKIIRAYEEETGLRITKAEMTNFEDTRFFTTTIFMPPKTTKKDA